MRGEILSQMTRPEEGERGLGASHRRGGMGVASYRRPPEGSHLRIFPEGKRGASATSKAPGVKRKVESMRDKGAKRVASGKLHIDDGCMGGGESIDFDDRLSNAEDNDIYDNDFLKLPNGNPSNRRGIFHYCIMAYKLKTEKRPIDQQINSDTTAGWAIYNGDTFILALGVQSNTKKVARNFIHELGHNFYLYHTPHTYTAGSVPSDANTCMNEDKRECVDYHSIEWKSLDFSFGSYGI